MTERRRGGRAARRGGRATEPSKRAGLTAIVVAVAAGGVLGLANLPDLPATAELPTCASVDTLSDGAVAGYRGEQLDNAAAIADAGAALGFGLEGQRLGVMAAMGESGLRNLDYGDWETSGVRNPDGTPTSSLGLFQQQEWWGSEAERMDPTVAATRFFQRLATIDGWESMEPSRAIHLVQVNADPDHYRRWLDASGEVTVALSCAG